MADFDRLRIAVMSANDELRASHTACQLAQEGREHRALVVDEIDLTSLAVIEPRPANAIDPVPGQIAALFPRVNAADGFIVVTSAQHGAPALRATWTWFADACTDRPVGLVFDSQLDEEHHPLRQLWRCITSCHTVPPLIMRQRTPPRDSRASGAAPPDDADDFLDQLCWWARILRDARRRYPRHL